MPKKWSAKEEAERYAYLEKSTKKHLSKYYYEQFDKIIPSSNPIIPLAPYDMVCNLCGQEFGNHWDIGGTIVCQYCLVSALIKGRWDEHFLYKKEHQYIALETLIDTAIMRITGRNSPYRNVPQQLKAELLQGASCVFCGSEVNLQIDHIHPVSKGGSNHPKNLQVLCRSCNLRKRDKVL